jgi:sulfatase maturation enzyme AslB (radical SAM superfamily)
MNKPKLWCPLAFNGVLSVLEGRYHLCCHSSLNAVDVNTGIELSKKTHTLQEAFDSEFFQSIRNNLTQGIKDENCSKCWKEEAQGIESARLYEIKRLSEYESSYTVPEMKYVDVALGNQCNIKCRSCNPNDSSLWAKEYYDINLKESSITFRDFKKEKTFLEKDDSRFMKELLSKDLSKVKHLGFFGGEPFLMKSTWRILKFLIDHGYSQNINLVFDTNATIWDIHKSQILENFKEVRLRLSIDDLQERFNYLRHPADWAAVYENIKSIVKWKNQAPSKRLITIQPSVSSYNIWDIENILKFADDIDSEFFINLVQEPTCISLLSMPNSIKKYFRQHVTELITRYPQHRIQLEKLTEYYLIDNVIDNDWSDFAKEVNVRDNYRNESFQKTFPEYYSFIKDLGYNI